MSCDEIWALCLCIFLARACRLPSWDINALFPRDESHALDDSEAWLPESSERAVVERAL